jgi:NADPH:quinone reductase-like Zn-dependent oxidoreductase
MKAAVLSELGVPRVSTFREPVAGEGQAVVEVTAAGLNPVDVAISAGRYFAGPPPLPSVAGREGVGILDDRRVYFDAPIAPFGSMAERTLIPAGSAYPVLDAVGDGLAVSLGISGLAAWLALTWRAQLKEGEHVLVLGATGVLGQIAVQAAKLLGADRVVGAGRSSEGLQRCVELGADAIVRLDEQDDLAGAFAEACEGRIDVVLDPLCGEPLTASVDASTFGARIVQLGQGAAPNASVSSAAIRGKMLTILGHANFATPPEVKREAYARMGVAAAAGEIVVDVDVLPLEHLEEAWRRVQAGAHRKILLTP